MRKQLLHPPICRYTILRCERRRQQDSEAAGADGAADVETLDTPTEIDVSCSYMRWIDSGLHRVVSRDSILSQLRLPPPRLASLCLCPQTGDPAPPPPTQPWHLAPACYIHSTGLVLVIAISHLASLLASHTTASEHTHTIHEATPAPASTHRATAPHRGAKRTRHGEGRQISRY